ncbi:MAG: TrmH family RNA methyltransferase [Acidimicrobiales bacterium]
MRGLLQKRSARWAEGVFVAEGAELLRTALRAGVAVESVYLAPEGAQDPATKETCDDALRAGARLFHLAPGVLERVADTVTPQPVLTVLPMIGDLDPAPTPAVEAIVVVLVDVRDPGNAGTVLRTADAAGVGAVVFCGESVDPYNPKTVRASAGSLFHVPFSVQDDPVALATSLAARGYRTMAAVVRDGDDYAEIDWAVPTALFLGNEAAGLRPGVRASLSGAVAIPMAGRAESLNVGMACAVLCFEALRQRRRGDGHLRSRW